MNSQEATFTNRLENLERLPIVLLCSLALILASCSSSSTGPGNGDDDDNGGNTPQEPTFSNVQVVLNNNCGGAGCHIGEETNGVRLDSYDEVINSVGTRYGTEIVEPGDPDNSPIIDKIANADPQFGDQMPLNSAPLTDDQISLIRDWIAEGAENN